MAEIVPVTSEALEAQIRDLLPSQRGFGEDLQASNVITPIIDLTAAAQGTTTPELLQTALAFGSQTSFLATNASVVVANTAGFYRIFGVSSIRAVGNANTRFEMSDGLSTKVIWRQYSAGQTVLEFDFVVFLDSGDSISAATTTADSYLAGSSRQIADSNGNLVYPSGFTPQ